MARVSRLARLTRNRAQDYGLDVLKPLRPGETPLYQQMRGRVYYIRSYVSTAQREKLTQALCDFPQADLHPCVPVWLFWRPHLEPLVDLPARRKEHRARLAAGQALSWHIRRRFAWGLREMYLVRLRSSRHNLLHDLRHNEIRRRQGPPPLPDTLEHWSNATARQELMNHADRMPEPWRVAKGGSSGAAGAAGDSGAAGGSGGSA